MYDDELITFHKCFGDLGGPVPGHRLCRLINFDSCLSHGPFVWAVDNQSFVDGSNYFFLLTEFNCIYLGNAVHVNVYI